jgi:hypothetical protein
MQRMDRFWKSRCLAELEPGADRPLPDSRGGRTMRVLIRWATALALALCVCNGSAQETNAAALQRPAESPDLRDLTQLLNQALKAYGTVVSELNTDAGLSSGTVSNQPAANVEDLIQELAKSGELQAAIASTARTAGLWERILGGLPCLLMSLLSAVLASVLTLAGDRLLSRRRARRMLESRPMPPDSSK